MWHVGGARTSATRPGEELRVTGSGSECESGRRLSASVPSTCPLGMGSVPPSPHAQWPALEAHPFLAVPGGGVPTIGPTLPNGRGPAPALRGTGPRTQAGRGPRLCEPFPVRTHR